MFKKYAGTLQKLEELEAKIRGLQEEAAYEGDAMMVDDTAPFTELKFEVSGKVLLTMFDCSSASASHFGALPITPAALLLIAANPLLHPSSAPPPEGTQEDAAVAIWLCAPPAQA